MNFHGSHSVVYNHWIHFKSTTHTDRTRLQTMSNYVQCNICQKWYTNQRGLLIHLGYCRERHNASEQNVANHNFLEHNPLKSCYDQAEHLNPFAVYDGEFDNSSISEEEPDDNFGNTHTDFDEFGQNGFHDTKGQCSTALSKLQIRLNDVINRHKAPLLLYDEIVHLINDYISSDNFSKYGKLKTRQSYKTNGNDSSNCNCIEASE